MLQLQPAANANGIGTNGHANHGPSTPLYNEIMELVQQQTSPCVSPVPPVTSKPPTLVSSTNEARGGREAVEDDGHLSAVCNRRDSNRDSNMSNVTVTDTTIVRGAALATRAVANMISPNPKKRDADVQQAESLVCRQPEEAEEEDDEDDDEELVFPPTPSPVQSTFLTEETPRNPSRHYKTSSIVSGLMVAAPSLTPPPAPGSPHSSYFSESATSSSECDSQSQSRSSSSRPNSDGVPVYGPGEKPPALPLKDPSVYLRMSPGVSPQPSPVRSTFSDRSSLRETFGAPSKVERQITEDPDATMKSKPSIKINGVRIDESSMSHDSSTVFPTSATPAKRYRGWLSEVVAPLEEFIDEATDPRDHYIELQEIAEAESGSVYAARVVKPEALGLPSDVAFVAIKNVPILPSGSPKLLDLQKELTLVRGVLHKNVLAMDALYVDLVEDSLWIRMELMERSLADVVGLVAEGLMVQERMIARFASDVRVPIRRG